MSTEHRRAAPDEDLTSLFLRESQTRRGRLMGFLSLVLVVVALKLTADGVGVDGLRNLVEQVGFWAPALFVALRASTYVFAPLSIPGIEISAGLLFGIWWGTALSVLGQTLGGSVSFWIARVLGQPVVARLAGRGAVDRLEELYSRVHGWRGLLFARLVLPGYDFLSYAVGLTPLPFYQYVLVTALGGLPTTLVHVALGSSLTEDPLQFILVTLGMGVLGAIAIYASHWASRRRRREASELESASV